MTSLLATQLTQGTCEARGNLLVESIVIANLRPYDVGQIRTLRCRLDCVALLEAGPTYVLTYSYIPCVVRPTLTALPIST